MTESAVEFRGVTVRRRGRILVDAVTFSVPKARVHALLGHNGAGKTTLLRAMGGLIPVARGEVRATGRTSILFAENSFPGEVLVSDVLRYSQRIHCVRPSRAADVVETTGVSRFMSQSISSLSTGMRQRVAIATALLADTATLVLDEPTSGLDPQGVDVLLGLIDALRAEGRTVLVCSHDLAQLETICDGVTCLRDGSVVSDGPVRQVARDVAAPGHLLRTSDDAHAADVLAAAGVGVRLTPRGIAIPSGTDLTTAILSLAHQVSVLEATVDRSLFARIYQRDASAPTATRRRRAR